MLRKILYIEDEPDILSIALIALQDIGGLEVKACATSKEALSIAVEYQPDLFIIDVMMPGMDGPTTLKELRKLPQFTSTPIIFMTAKTQNSEVKEYLNLGALSVITKPFNPMTLADTVKELWQAHVVGAK